MSKQTENENIKTSARAEGKETSGQQENPRLRRMKKIAAWAGIILLALVYLITFIVGITGAGKTSDLLMICIVCTVLIPVLMYAMILTAKILSRSE